MIIIRARNERRGASIAELTATRLKRLFDFHKLYNINFLRAKRLWVIILMIAVPSAA